MTRRTRFGDGCEYMRQPRAARRVFEHVHDEYGLREKTLPGFLFCPCGNVTDYVMGEEGMQLEPGRVMLCSVCGRCVSFTGEPALHELTLAEVLSLPKAEREKLREARALWLAHQDGKAEA